MKTWNDLANPGVESLVTYEPGRPIDEVARELGFASGDEIDKLASNENALGPSPRALKAMLKAAATMHRYPDGGAYYLRQAVAAKLGVTMEQVLPGNGSNELIELMAHAFLGPGKGIVMADYAFVVYRLIAAAFSADVVSVPMRDFTHDLDAMLAAVTPETRIVFVSNPNNPTGTMVDQDAMDRLVEGVPDHVIVCFDEAYIELLPEDRQPNALEYIHEGRKVIVLRTFSKAYGLAGLRIGYGIAAPDCIGLLNKTRQPFNVNAMAQAAALAALDDDEYVAKSRLLVTDGLRFFEAEFKRLGLEFVPSVTNFILVNVGDGRPVFEAMMKEGVIARPMNGYGLPEYVRITVGADEENRRCIEALQRIRS